MHLLIYGLSEWLTFFFVGPFGTISHVTVYSRFSNQSRTITICKHILLILNKTRSKIDQRHEMTYFKLFSVATDRSLPRCEYEWQVYKEVCRLPKFIFMKRGLQQVKYTHKYVSLSFIMQVVCIYIKHLSSSSTSSWERWELMHLHNI